MNTEHFEIKQIHVEADDAYKVDLKVEDHQVKTFWIPRSVCKMDADKKVLQVQSWWAQNEIYESED